MPHNRTCSVPDCGKPFSAKGYCASHYSQWKNHGDPLKRVRGPKRDPIARFLRLAEIRDGCWNWLGTTSRSNGPDRYPMFRSKHYPRAHRYGYALLHGNIPAGLTIDHLCGNTLCVRPDHLEAVSNRENTIRGNNKGAQHHRQTHCTHGHPLLGDNLRLLIRSDGHPVRRVCRTCERERGKRWRDSGGQRRARARRRTAAA